MIVAVKLYMFILLHKCRKLLLPLDVHLKPYNSEFLSFLHMELKCGVTKTLM